ncbi:MULTISPECIES: metallophosphoesterase [Rossellomorea]|uniref:metallophosphoesterase n=1 Tax=Rossellomorea TaxID=2837508 RepID=UPI001CCF4A62|nr:MULTISPECIES: metallophosphoesterase [Rossellomorea]MCA0147781.1 metallophosphoesterase [Rossellomorea vietnamensis]WGG44019.1 metallophosphoesterase [Rossellomorea sp. DA94]
MLEISMILLAGGVSLLFYMVYEARRNIVKIEKVKLPHYPRQMKPVSLFFISDIHKREISNEIIEEVRGKTDLVIIGGDLLEKGVPFSRVERNLDKLLTLGSVYFIWGNNDYEVNTSRLKQIFKKKGIIEIVNSSVKVKVHNGVLNLIGVDDASTQRANYEASLEGVHPDEFNLLISHDPRLVNQVRKEDGIDFMISGHTHGGQIRLFGWGMYKKGRLETLPETTLLVSNGYGTTAIPLRLGAPAETHLVMIDKG